MTVSELTQPVPHRVVLPDSVQMVADVIGEDAALKLVEQWPPTPGHCVSIYVPARIPDAHRLVDIIGMEQARTLSRHFAGEVLKLAAGGRLRSRLRRADMRSRVAAGERVPDVARQLEVSERTVRRACEGVRRGARHSDKIRS